MSENGADHERARHLMMAALDGELSPDEQRELDRRLAADAGLREEWERLRQVKQVTREMRYREPPPEVWDDYWTSVYSRVERGLGWILVSLGALIVFGYGAWIAVDTLLADSGLPGFFKVGLFALVLGAAVVFVSVVREKLFVRRTDPYRGVQR